MIFEINFPTRVLLGENVSEQTGEKLKELGVTKAICVFDKNIKSFGLADKVMDSIKKAGIAVVEYDGIMPDPTDAQVDEAGEKARKEQCDGVVGIGGGSCLDAAKGVNCLLGNPGPVAKYFGFGVETKLGKPLILIPTTSGTGAEISPVAAITDTSTGRKGALFGPNCVAKYAIVDPMLTLGLPPKTTASTGLDTLYHGIEAYTSAQSNPMADMLAFHAVFLAGKSLKAAVEDGSNVEARFDMSFACALAGMAMSQSPTHMGHSIATPLGSKYHIAHGLIVAAVSPCVIDYLGDINPQKVRDIGKALMLDIDENLSDKEVASKISDWLRALNKELGMPTMKELGIPEADLMDIAKDTLENPDPCINFVPRKPSQDEILKMLKKEYTY